ncbi:hypothetical protein WKW80_14080 [Variovorax humicola]|uniref:Uncharacterized protein n=1 Tax=Variovorax humicola TaxID=1769758 RepID=A0ABU8VZA0_9BURK
MKTILYLLLFFLSPPVFAGDSKIASFRDYLTISLPPSISARKKSFEAPSLFASADCVELRNLRKKPIGLACIFKNLDSNSDVLNELGFFSSAEIAHPQESSALYYAATSLAVYPMKIWREIGKPGYFSENDCDIYKNQIYRATGTCLSAFAFLSERDLLYIDIVLRDNVKNKDIISRNEKIKILSGISIGFP